MGGRWRALVALMLLAPTCVVIQIPASVAAADLTLGKILWFNDDGDSHTTIGPNGAASVWLGEVDYNCDTFYPAANVYVVAGTPVGESTLTDVSGTPNVIIGTWGGAFSETLAYAKPTGKLGPGTYSVVYDECQDGKYDVGVDAVFLNAITVEFPPGELPPIDPAIKAMKDQAKINAIRATVALEGYKLYIAIKEKLELLECLTGGIISCAISQLKDKLQEVFMENLRLTFGLIDVKEAALDVAEDTALMYRGLGADPPDPAYAQPTVLGPVTNVSATDPDAFDAASARFANAMSVDAVLAEGLLHAVERYQGADIAGDAAWARQHLTEATDLAGLLAGHQSETNAAIAELRTIIASDPSDIDAALTVYEQNRVRVAAEGFSPGELAALASAGADSADVTAVLGGYLADPSAAGITRADMVARLDTLIASNIQWAQALTNLGGQFASLEAVLANNLDAGGRPLPNAGGPYEASAGAPISLDSGASVDHFGSITQRTWDTDTDTSFDDANGTSPTVSVSGAYDALVGLRVVDDEGNSAVDYTRLRVVDGNRAPEIEVVAPPLGYVELAKGGPAQPFSVTPSDPDGDTITGEWFVDGVSVGAGSSFVFTEVADAGLHTVRFTASDSTASRGIAWMVSVVGVDGDGDGWTSEPGVDCDDSAATINPGVPEIQGNAIDENCDGVAEPERNDPPAARNSTLGTPEDMPIQFTLIAPDPENDPVQFVIDSGPSDGTLDISAAPLATYTPALDFTGTDSFTFTASDGELSATATVTVNVSALDDKPIAFPVAVAGMEDGAPVAVNLTASDAEGSPLTFVASPPSVGSFGGTEPNLTYTAPANFNGAATFAFTASDGSLTSDPANGVIEIAPANDAPEAADAAAVTAEDTAVVISPVIGDIDGDTLELVVVAPPEHGTVDVAGANFTYTPSPEFSGADAFTYRASDGDTVSPDRVVSLTVTPVNDPPVSENAEASLAEDDTVWLELPGFDPDSPLVFTITTPPSNGTVQNLIGRRVLYRPDPEFHGADSLVFSVTDGVSTVSGLTMSIVVTEINDPPVAVDDHAVTTADHSVIVDVIANDSDAEGTALTLVSVGAPEAGNAAIGAPGTIVVSPPLGHIGAINVPYTIYDSDGGAAVGTVTVLALADAAAAATTFTQVGEFSTGDAFNVEQGGPNTLQVNSKAQAFNRIWVAVSTKGTIVKIDTDSGAILGEYRSAPNGDGQDPSRTTVDQNGNVWATNRASNTVLQIGSVENGQCVDRNLNGIIDTSTAQNDIRPWTNTGGVDSDGGVDTALDECILKYIRVSSSGTRHVSVTKDNDIWVSGTGNRVFNLIDGDTGAIMRTEGPVGYGGYGGLIDQNGVIWSATYPAELLRWDTANPLAGPQGGNWEALPRGAEAPNSYGTCIDLFGNVWVTELGSFTRKYAPDGTLLGTFYHGFHQAQGCAVDGNGDVWVAHSLNGGSAVGHLTNEGVLVGSVPVGSGPTGISVDAAGKVWATNYYSGTVSRIDPELGPIHAGTGKRVGLVDFTTVGLGGNPYNYSDMTGSTLQGVPTSGTWTATFDGGSAGAAWGGIDWHATVPGDGSLEVRVAVGDVAATLGTGDVVTDGGVVIGSGQFAKVTVTLVRAANGLSPHLHDLSLWTATDAPVALAQAEATHATDEDVPMTVDMGFVIPVQAPPGVEVVVVAGPSDGTFTRLDSTAFMYTPNPNFHGHDMFLYRLDDGDLLSAVGGAQIVVHPVNDAPQGAPNSIATDEDTPVGFELTGTDLEGDPLRVIITDMPDHGTLTPAQGAAAPSAFTFTPAPNFSGADSLTFVVEDDPPEVDAADKQESGADTAATGPMRSTAIIVPIQVAPVNDPPTANPANGSTDQGLPVDLALTGADVDGDVLTFQMVTDPAHGSVVIQGAVAKYTPDASFSGTDTFTFRANDGSDVSPAATGIVIVNPVVVLPPAPTTTTTTTQPPAPTTTQPPAPVPTPAPPVPPDVPPTQLPATGTNSSLVVRWGLWTTLLGFGLLILTRRWRYTTPPRVSE
jgi:streptogramin lyase